MTPDERPMFTRVMLRTAFDLVKPQDTTIVGLAVVHKGVAMRLYPQENLPGSDIMWTATCDPQDHDGRRLVEGLGLSPTEALDACAEQVAAQAAAQRQIDEENDA